MAGDPFVFLNSISGSSKYNLIGEGDQLEGNYVPFIINRGLSQHADTILYANEMNLYWGLDNKLQYDYLLNSIRPANRKGAWAKSKKDKDVDLLMEYFSYNKQKATEALRCVSKKQLREIRKSMDTGGVK